MVSRPSPQSSTTPSLVSVAGLVLTLALATRPETDIDL